MFTRKEFETYRIEEAENMAQDKKLQKDAFDILIRADQFSWVHQTNWFGEPVLQLPQDLFAFQEIIYNTRPEYIIECGVAWGGSLLFYSTLMEVIGGEKIIAVDTYIPDDLMERINSFKKLSERIAWIKGSSIETITYDIIKAIIGNSKKVLVHLDSNHTHEHVFKELTIYSEFVGKGNYIVCGDTIIEYIPEQKHRPRPWGHGNNPKTALDEFLKVNDRFIIDEKLNNKLLFTCNPGGYLLCVK